MFFNDFYHILKIKDHLHYKSKIVNKISSFEIPHENKDVVNTNNQIIEYTSQISNSDWTIKNRINWFEYCFSDTDKKRIEDFICKKFKVKSIEISNYWYNQYYKQSGSGHPFHVHYDTDLVGVYYIELDDNSLRTSLINPHTKKETIPKSKEGDILFFSGDIIHGSPQNFTETRKTIVSFNINFNREVK